MMKLLSCTFCLLVAFSCLGQVRTNPVNQPEELGTVSWYRNYDEAIEASKKEGKSVFILFQEVPGCSTCKKYGNVVLSNPLLADAIQHEFIPLVIYNNKGGSDAEVLRKYGEPAWNNPVVRIVDQKGKDLVPRLSANYTELGLIEKIISGLQKTSRTLPGYIKILQSETPSGSTQETKEKVYKMYCFWTGEGQLGNSAGVIATEPGFMNGHEVVKVTYNPAIVNARDLDKYASSQGCDKVDKLASFRPDKDPQYYLKHTDFRYLPLTPLQRTKINTAIAMKTNPADYLSPTQVKWLTRIKKTSDLKIQRYDGEFVSSWKGLAQCVNI